MGSFVEMEEKTRGGIRDRFSDRAGTMSLQDWKILFITWMRKKRQCNTNFNDWYAFKLLPKHLEHEALQTYEQWTDTHSMKLREVERYWEIRVELVPALKEGTASSLMAVPEVKSEVPEEIYVVNVEEASPGKPKDKGSAPTATSTSSVIFPLSRSTQATQAALASLGAPPVFEPLREFELHLQEEYGGFHRDQMQRIYDFRWEKDDTPRTMYTRLARFAREFGGVFAEIQLVKVFLLKINKRLLDLALPKIIMEFGGRVTFAEAFAIVEQYDRALYQHNATDLVSLLADSSKSWKAPIATARLAEAEVDKILYCWSCRKARHAKKDFPSKQKQTQTIGNPKRTLIVPAKDSTKGRVIVYPSS